MGTYNDPMTEPLTPRFFTRDGRPCGYGASVHFGSWQGESIEWTVLGARDEKVLLISKFALEVRPFAGLDAWLNGPFAEAAGLDAFPLCSPLFCLSPDETAAYFRCLGRRGARPTAHARTQGARVDAGGECWWWLSDGSACCAFGVDPQPADAANVCVRPAVWVQL